MLIRLTQYSSSTTETFTDVPYWVQYGSSISKDLGGVSSSIPEGGDVTSLVRITAFLPVWCDLCLLGGDQVPNPFRTHH